MLHRVRYNSAVTHPVRKLKPCLGTPNCVSTQSDPADRLHYIAPIRYEGAPEEALSRLETIVSGMKRTRLVERGGDYLHFTFKSRIFRFVDDVEFALERDTQTIHFRSASRLGYGDHGVNRQRMEAIRRKWER